MSPDQESTETVKRKGRFYELPIVGLRGTRERAFTFRFGDAARPEWTLSISQPFTAGFDGDLRWSDPSRPVGKGVLRTVQEVLVVRADVEGSGALHLAFETGLEIEVPRSPYEAWELRRGHRLVAVAVAGIAGGGVAIWRCVVS